MADPVTSEPAELPEATPATRGRGVARGDRDGSRKARVAGAAARKIKGRTVYLPDDLFERIIVQAHRRDKTISEYVTWILERQVPDHRAGRGDQED